MLKINKTINAYGSSSIPDEQGTETVVVQMSANVNSESKGLININTSIINARLYFENKIAVDSEIEEFNNYVYSIVEGGMNNE